MEYIIVEAEVSGRTFYLAYTVQAMLEIKQILKRDDGKEDDLIEVIRSDDIETYGKFCGVAASMAKAGELLRRCNGYPAEKIVKEEEILVMLTPAELQDLRGACMEAVIRGLTRETEEEEVDVGLAELKKKKTCQPRRS